MIPRLPPSASGAERVSAINRLIDEHNKGPGEQVWFDATHARMFIGYQLNGWGTGKNWGVKISKPGFDVRTTTDGNLLFKLAY